MPETVRLCMVNKALERTIKHSMPNDDHLVQQKPGWAFETWWQCLHDARDPRDMDCVQILMLRMQMTQSKQH